jgi:hypothetical protein
MCGRVLCDCSLDGTNLWGKVQFVDGLGFPTFRVQKITVGTPDLKVQAINSTGTANSCGKWQEVTPPVQPDFKVQLITIGTPDFTIKDETFQPGLGFGPSN